MEMLMQLPAACNKLAMGMGGRFGRGEDLKS
jgi:hypothetical protein